jgi:phage terminase Nu1 subunit (DNA packaging protein)
MTLMTETVTIARRTADKPVSRRRSAKPATVSASALALHLDCSRAYIGKLEAEGVIQRQRGGFPLDQSRVAYLRYLRRERRQSSRGEADADYVKVKTEMLQLRLMEKRRELVLQEDVNELVDGLCGVVLTHLSSMPARCAPRGDLAIRRNIERVVFEVRTEIANICQQMADKHGEPPLDEQG